MALEIDVTDYTTQQWHEPPGMDEVLEEVRAQNKKMNKTIASFLGDDKIVDIPLSASRMYCDMMAWALNRQCRAGGWKLAHAFGHSGGTAIYSRVNVGPGKWEELFYGGLVLLRRKEVRLVVHMSLDPAEGAEMVVRAAIGQQRKAEAFARAMQTKLREKKLYRGQNVEFSMRMKFLEIANKTWDDIALSQDMKEAVVAHTTRFLDWSSGLEPYGVSPRRGLLLTGKPGTGKTLICKVLMNTSPGVTCILAHTGDLLHPIYIDDLFAVAADLSPSIVFLEDIDLIGQGRIRSGYGTGDALSRLLFALDGVQDCRNVVIVATTNWLEILDEALKDRPSRFDRVIEIDPPDATQRRAYLDYLATKIPIPADIVEALVGSTAGLTPAQIQEVVHCAAIEALVPPDSPEYWKTVFTPSAVEKALKHVKRGNGRVGFPGSGPGWQQ
ncbi:MAG: ATP-binding protein [Dehalococcoidia bacterium]|nr:ATP-binding protein [Dehalococcoidia bacterium]